MKEYNRFMEFACLSEKDLKAYLIHLLSVYGYTDIVNNDGYIYAKGTDKVALVSHMDTVHKTLPKNIWTRVDNPRLIRAEEGIGGDDRLGIYIIDKVLDSGLRPTIIFTEQEEVGCIGANKFVTDYKGEDLGINFFIELDRKGSDDAVYYSNDNEDFAKYIESFGFKKQFGSYTDISKFMPAFNLSGVNFSCGYYKPHTTDEYVNLDEAIVTAEKVIRIIKDVAINDVVYEYVEKKVEYKPYNKWNGYTSFARYDYYNDISKSLPEVATTKVEDTTVKFVDGYEQELLDEETEIDSLTCEFIEEDYARFKLEELEGAICDLCNGAAEFYNIMSCEYFCESCKELAIKSGVSSEEEFIRVDSAEYDDELFEYYVSLCEEQDSFNYCFDDFPQ